MPLCTRGVSSAQKRRKSGRPPLTDPLLTPLPSLLNANANASNEQIGQDNLKSEIATKKRAAEVGGAPLVTPHSTAAAGLYLCTSINQPPIDLR